MGMGVDSRSMMQWTWSIYRARSTISNNSFDAILEWRFYRGRPIIAMKQINTAARNSHIILVDMALSGLEIEVNAFNN